LAAGALAIAVQIPKRMIPFRSVERGILMDEPGMGKRGDLGCPAQIEMSGIAQVEMSAF
jgi:hypothetical protein